MRISADKEDPGYAAWVQSGSKARVFLDGVELLHVYTADEERRLIVQADLDAEGRLQIDREKNSIRRVERFGHVRIEIGN